MREMYEMLNQKEIYNSIKSDNLDITKYQDLRKTNTRIIQQQIRDLDGGYFIFE